MLKIFPRTMILKQITQNGVHRSKPSERGRRKKEGGGGGRRKKTQHSPPYRRENPQWAPRNTSDFAMHNKTTSTKTSLQEPIQEHPPTTTCPLLESLVGIRRAPVLASANAASDLARLAALVAIRVVAGPREGGALTGQEELRGLHVVLIVGAKRVGAGALAVLRTGVARAFVEAPEVEAAPREDGVITIAGACDGDGEAVAVAR